MLDEIKKQIEALPEECQLIAVKEACGGTLGITHDLMGQKSMLIADAKALCASHTALEAQVAEMKELLDAARNINGKDWGIRWYEENEHSFASGQPGWYCWKDDWEGGHIGPFTSPLEAFKAVKENK
jgi:hypothetical protein